MAAENRIDRRTEIFGSMAFEAKQRGALRWHELIVGRTGSLRPTKAGVKLGDSTTWAPIPVRITDIVAAHSDVLLRVEPIGDAPAWFVSDSPRRTTALVSASRVDVDPLPAPVRLPVRAESGSVALSLVCSECGYGLNGPDALTGPLAARCESCRAAFTVDDASVRGAQHECLRILGEA